MEACCSEWENVTDSQRYRHVPSSEEHILLHDDKGQVWALISPWNGFTAVENIGREIFQMQLKYQSYIKELGQQEWGMIEPSCVAFNEGNGELFGAGKDKEECKQVTYL